MKPEIAHDVLEELSKKYPDPKYELNWTTPFELLVATILAARCTDKLVNEVTSRLFKRFRTPRDFYDASLEDIRQEIKEVTFYQRKAEMLSDMSIDLVVKFGGEVPRTLWQLTTLSGVGRKTANVVLATAFNIAQGIIVDTHVARVSNRTGLSDEEKPDDIEKDLMRIFPEETWTFLGPAMVLHGRYTCTSRNPQCKSCPLDDICPKIGV